MMLTGFGTESGTDDEEDDTTNRQRAVKVLAENVDVVLVVGSKNSSNSSKLRHVAEEMGKRAYLIDGKEDIDNSWFD